MKEQLNTEVEIAGQFRHCEPRLCSSEAFTIFVIFFGAGGLVFLAEYSYIVYTPSMLFSSDTEPSRSALYKDHPALVHKSRIQMSREGRP